MISTFASYANTSRNMERDLQRVASQPQQQREISYFRDRIGSIKTVDDFIGDRRVFAFAMRAFGLDDMTYAKAFMAKVLREGHNEPGAFVNGLTDPRYLAFAETFDFASFGKAATSFTKANQGTIDRYIRQTLEQQVGSDNQGARLALYFERVAPTVTSFYGILADPALAEVARTAFSIPAATAAIDIEKQAALLASKFDIADLRDPEKLPKMLERFSALWDVKNPATTTQSGIGLLFGNQSSAGVGVDAMLQILARK
jgi:hypothetical protein